MIDATSPGEVRPTVGVTFFQLTRSEAFFQIAADREEVTVSHALVGMGIKVTEISPLNRPTQLIKILQRNAPQA